MPLLKNGKDMSNAFIGDQELSKIMLGDKVVWENNKIIELGSGTSWDIKALYPSLYDKLTTNNFFFKTANTITAYDSVRMRPGDDREWHGFTGKLNKSYNPTTGILSAYGNCNGYTGPVSIVMCLKPEKLINLGTASGFSLKTYADWQQFTNDNFLISGSQTVSHGNMFYAQDYVYSDSGTGTLSFNKSYNASTGYLTSNISLRSVDTSGVYGYYNGSDTKGLDIYLNPKVGA